VLPLIIKLIWSRDHHQRELLQQEHLLLSDKTLQKQGTLSLKKKKATLAVRVQASIARVLASELLGKATQELIQLQL
jgi:hypothetical protein